MKADKELDTMAEDKVELNDINYRRVFAWTELFHGFKVAIDPKKLVLAAAGIVMMWFGWWLLAFLFYGLRSEPRWETWPNQGAPQAWSEFKEDRQKWNLLYKAAGPNLLYSDANDLAENSDEWSKLNEAIKKEPETHVLLVDGKRFQRTPKPYGRLRLWPGTEDRGPNPYLMVTGQVERDTATGRTAIPWEQGTFWNWFLTREGPVVLEPLVKFLRPLVYIVQPHAGLFNQFYFLLVMVWTAFVWAIFGGAITRMAAVQIARRDKISIVEALRFTWARIVSYFTAPLLPVLFVGIIVVLLILFGLIHLVPWLGDVWSGLLWPIVILAGLVMAAVLIGLVGWPLMVATISTEGSDNFDALSRAYSYLYQYPWHYLWYCLVAVVYGAALIFFVGFMGSFMAYLGKWGVEQTPWVGERDPGYLFAYAPESFGWRALLMEGTKVNGQHVVVNGSINPDAYNAYYATYSPINKFGAFLASVWIHLLFLLVLGFGYSYFWTASTFIYLLMRRKVDDTEFDEVYLEEEEPEETYSMTTPSTPAPAPSAPGSPSMQMVEAPTLRSSAPPPPPSASPPPSPPAHETAGSVATHEPGPGGTTPESAPPHTDGNRPPEGGGS